MLFSGNAVVYFKGKRIDTLHVKSEPTGGDILNHGICSTYYYENTNNILFKDCRIYGW